MAKLIYTELSNGTAALYQPYNSETTSIRIEWVSQALLFDQSGGESAAFYGEGIDYESGAMIAGSIDKIAFKDADGNDLAVISGIDVDAASLSTIWGIENGGMQAVVKQVLSGNDRITGSKVEDSIHGYDGNDRIDGGKGTDYLDGGLGKDTLTGGKGDDFFIFTAGDGKDTITDFDADGGDRSQDYIHIVDAGEIHIVGAGKNTIIEYGDGDEILLLGVSKSHVKIGDDFVDFLP